MAEAAKTREARRRRRILEQGSDRIAFITGRVQTLPQPNSDPPPAASSSSTISDHPNTALPPPPPPTGSYPHSNSPLCAVAEPDEDSISLLQNLDAAVETLIQSLPTVENEISTAPCSEIEPELVENPQAAPPDSSSLENSHYQNLQEHEQRFTIIPSDISSAINSSRGTRFFCSTIMAMWVIAAYGGLFSLLGIHLVKSVVMGFRPIYIVLLTNWSVVAARLFAGRQRGFGRLSRRGNDESLASSADWGAQLARTLEIGLLLQSVLDAVFMDCAVYAIVLVCGLSLLHT